jgi:CubicO group peptidase (beta-lactamase class C family)
MKPLPSTKQSGTALARVRTLLEDAIEQTAFPGAALVVTHQKQISLALTAGRHTYAPDSTPVTSDSIFDLASVSKVVGTTMMAIVLFERGKLDLDLAVAEIIPEFAAGSQIDFRMLLAHSSGLPAYIRLFEKAQSRAALLDLAFRVPVEAQPGSRAQYSDIGFILLGVALERIAGESLDTFCQREVFDPLNMMDTCYNPEPAQRNRIVPTIEDTSFRKRRIQGEVHDENAFVLGGVAGHAGIFSTAVDVAKFAECMLRGGAPLVQPSTLQLFTRRQTTPSGTSRALGWDTPSFPSQSGRYFSTRSFGHLGYTGTSLWIDPERDLSVAFLTNRVWPDCGSDRIRRFRPAIHDAIIEALEA